jgi:DNA (cytosine-5)-methyltransferase 1
MGPSIGEKLARIRDGARPRLLDLFSGCGGLSLGFVSAGCSSVGGVELDEHAARSYSWNFHPTADDQPDEQHAQSRNILDNKPQELLRSLEQNSTEKGIDIIVGGPPCPAFTRIGRAKLREIHQHPEAFKHDHRATLYIQYLEYVAELQPVALVMENVPDVLNWGGHNLGDEICEYLEQLNYQCSYTLLNAANYGVPQMRERFFLVAIHKKARVEFEFPTPTRKVDFPPGYSSSRKAALKNVLAKGLFARRYWYKEAPRPPSGAPDAVSAQQALDDLPPLTDHLHGKDRRGARRLDGKLPYDVNRPISAYAQFMKNWPGFEAGEHLRDHVTRCLSPRDYRLFKKMKPGDDYPKAHELATRLFQRKIEKRRKDAGRFLEGSPEYEELRAKYVPPYDPKKFPNKWRKMDANAPARTLMAHLGKDTYSHIHYSSAQQRVISVREAARLQSFPDGFRFSGTMNPAFRQIGNSVPPLLSWAIAHELLSRLGAGITNPCPEREQASQPGQSTKAKVA